ncbi:hypothetical protein AZ09_06950 [Acetobacter aceti 1023]|nr:hypothetical protein AZ09_06950 [Acetobacter aceti 1023]
MTFCYSRFLQIRWLASAILAGMIPSVVYAQPKCKHADGSLDLILHETGVVVNYGTGHGVFTYGTRQYTVEIKGGGILTFGSATIKATACVTNLGRVRDLAGTYWTIGGAASITNGSFVADMENARGVDMHVQGRVHGPLISGQIARFSVRFTSGNVPDL